MKIPPRKRKSKTKDISKESVSYGTVTSIMPKVKEESNINLSMELKSPCDEYIALKCNIYLAM